MINAQQLQGAWNRVRGQVKERWGQLTDDDLTFRGGNVDQLVGRIQQKTGESREAIEKFFNDAIGSGSNMVSQATQAVGNFAQQASGRLRDSWEAVADQAGDGYAQATRMVSRYPTQSVAAVFGLGVGLGLLIGLALRPGR
jgi:uncharacterized protein YjbJ (UPF0337 family)